MLLHAAFNTLGRENALGFIADSPSLLRRDLEEARGLTQSIGARLVEVQTKELENEGYLENVGTRCYFCRRELFDSMLVWARANGFPNLAYGEITDDFSDDRPGRRAAKELRVVAPLAKAGFGKEEVRHYAREVGLEVAEKPASACLSSRIPRGTRVTRERLKRIEAAEERVQALGFRVLRVRDHGATARLELGSGELERGQELCSQLEKAVQAAGFEMLELTSYIPPTERSGVSS